MADVIPNKVLSDIEKVSQETGYATSTIKAILKCESGNNQDARHINLNNSIDVGSAQINSIHFPEAKLLGIDLLTREGNLAYMTILIKKHGLRDWSASKHCWSIAI